MKFVKVMNAWVDPDAVVAVQPAASGKVRLHLTSGQFISVPDGPLSSVDARRLANQIVFELSGQKDEGPQ